MMMQSGRTIRKTNKEEESRDIEENGAAGKRGLGWAVQR